MPKLFGFLKETDAESIRRSHRGHAKEIAASMSLGASASKKDRATSTSTRQTVQRTSAPRLRGQEQAPTVTPVAKMRQKTAKSAGHQRSVEEDTVQALMDLALPQIKKPDNGDSEDKTMAGGVQPAGISDVGKWGKSDPIAFTMC